MMTDSIADLLTRIRNALRMRHAQVTIPYSKMKEGVVKILKGEGFILGYEMVGEKTKKTLVVALKYTPEGRAAIMEIRKVSKPGRRVYFGYEEMASSRGGLGLKILTTSKGLLSDVEARKQKLGGELLVEVW